jgi:hypothetical protein
MPEISNDGNYKRVTFKNSILVQTVPLYTRDIEDDPLWYSPADFSRFKHRDRYIEQHMENPSIVTRIHIQSEMGDCTRGEPCRRMRSWNNLRTLSDRKRDTVSYSSKSFRIPRSRTCDVGM